MIEWEDNSSGAGAKIAGFHYVNVHRYDGRYCTCVMSQTAVLSATTLDEAKEEALAIHLVYLRRAVREIAATMAGSDD